MSQPEGGTANDQSWNNSSVQKKKIVQVNIVQVPPTQEHKITCSHQGGPCIDSCWTVILFLDFPKDAQCFNT